MPVPRTGPSPAAAFARRVVRGRWEWPALAAAVPALAVVALAVLIGVVTGHTLPRSGAGWWTRTRIALALLVQGLGGSLRLSEPEPVVYSGSYDSLGDATQGSGDSGGFDTSGGSDGGSGGFDSIGGDGSSSAHRLHETLSVMPLSVTLLWIGLMVVVLRAARKRQSGPEAAVRVSVLATVAALALALVGQVHVNNDSLSTGPFLVALGAFLISLATSLAVLAGPGLGTWLAARPGVAAGYRMLRTALLALLGTVLLAGLVGLIVTACYYDDVTGWGLTAAALLLPNIGVSGLSLSWGGPLSFRERASGGGDAGGGGAFHHAVKLSDLSHVWGGGGLALALTTGLVCAVLIGGLALRRSRDRLEQFAVAGVYTLLFTGLVALAGLSSSGLIGAGGLTGAGTSTHTSVSSDVPEALLFALLWSAGGVLVVHHAVKRAGLPTPPPYTPSPHPPAVPPVPAPGPGPGPVLPAPRTPPPGTPAPGGTRGGGTVPPQPAEPPVMDLGIVQPDRLSEKPPRQE